MCAIKMVEKPRVNLHAINRSMREIPVTMSEFSMGILVTPINTVRHLLFMELMPMEAQVPMRVASIADKNAMTRVL